jgi:hypothetical protein
MSSSFDFENPYWSRKFKASERLYDGGEYDKKQTDEASYEILNRTMARIDLVIFFLDRLNIDDFRLQTGRINRRKLSKTLVALIAKRNEQRRKSGLSQVHEVGLRAMEMTIKELFSQK